jgi:hypothetical protein
MELTITNLIKIILALVVIVAVIYGVYRAVVGSLGGTFGAWNIGNSSKFILSLLK